MAPTLQDVTITPTLRAVVGVPDGSGPWPAVVVVHEAFGILPEMREQVQHLASLGYLAVMPDLFTEGGMRKCIGATFRALRSGEGKAWGDLEAARAWIGERDDTTGRVGVIGFCMGGAFALLAATRGDYDVASVNYGMLPADLDVVETSCPVVASFGAKDRTLKDAAARLEAAYEKHGVAADVREYPDAGHAFLNSRMTGPSILHPLMRVAGIGPKPAAAADAWQRITVFFDTHGLARG
jgi:carboxymethylenebutenolidase